jgi:hypothetical protein
VLNENQNRWAMRSWETVAVLVLTIVAFAVRVHQIDFYSLSEDESAKWAAIQEYRHYHFCGVNSEHPILPKVLAWASLTAGEHWSQVAAKYHWPSLMSEGWMRLPNVIFGALTAAVLYLLCRRMMGFAGSFAASVFWAVAPLPIALNRLMKEETPLTFFTLLACYFYCRAKQTNESESAKRWYDLSAIGFGLALASQYILHLLGLNALAWYIAGRAGLTPEPSQFSYKRFYFVMFISFVLVNPVILSPDNFQAIVHWLHHDGVKHSGYDFDGTLYLNFASRLFAGLPWFYYLWLLLVKTPIPILVAVLSGGVLLLRGRRTLASCFFWSLVLVQLGGLSVSGAKWIRYSLPLLPFLYLAGGYAVQQAWDAARKRGGVSLRFAGVAGVFLIGSLLLELQAWPPFYSLYLNSIGGGRQNVTRFFAPDEVSELDTREVAQRVCRSAPGNAKLATARPMSMAYYLQTCGRADIQVVPLYDPHYAPQDGDFVVLERPRRFVETQRFFDVLGNSGMPHIDVRVGPVLASRIYVLDSSADQAKRVNGESTLAQLRGSPLPFDTHALQSASRGITKFGSSNLSRRFTR